VRCDFAVNEGGGSSIVMDGRRLYTLSVGEKGIFRIKLRVEGTAGHASLPKVGDNALLKLAPLIAKLEGQPPMEANDVGLAFLSVVTGKELNGEDGLRAGLDGMRALGPELALLADLLVEPMMGITMTPTKARAGEKANVIPSSGEVLIDTRIPPGLGEDEAVGALADLMGEAPGEGTYEVEFSEAVSGNQSEFDTSLRDSIGEWLADADPEGELAPIVMPGFSDSHWFRKAFPDAVVYGFCPHREIELLQQAPLIHGADERVPASDVGLAAGFFRDLARKVL
jgi:acetylornithine deacetylase/succinyl-diaminopimelate desuccinylase-like protein